MLPSAESAAEDYPVGTKIAERNFYDEDPKERIGFYKHLLASK